MRKVRYDGGAHPPSYASLDLFYGTGLCTGQIDTQFLRSREDCVIRVTHFNCGSVRGEDFHVQAQRLHFLDQDLEGLGNARLGDVLALDDGFVDLHATVDVIRLDREEFLERVGRAISFERPHFHFTEALATELCLTTQRLLRDHGVRAGGARVDLVVHQVVELQDVHGADRDRIRERLAGAAVKQTGLAGGVDQALSIAGHVGGVQQARDFLFAGAVEHRRGNSGLATLARQVRQLLDPLGLAFDLPAGLGNPAEVRFEHLAHVHTARDTQRVQDDINGGAVGKEGHVLNGEDLGDNTLVAVAAGELVAVGDLALGSDVDADQLVHAGGQFVVVVAVEDAHADDGAGLAVGHLQGGVADFAGLLAEDSAQQALFRGQFGFTLRGDLSDQDVPCFNLGTDVDDAALVQACQYFLGHVGDVTGDFLGTKLGVAGIDLVLLDVDGGKNVLCNNALREDDGVLEVVAFP